MSVCACVSFCVSFYMCVCLCLCVCVCVWPSGLMNCRVGDLIQQGLEVCEPSCWPRAELQPGHTHDGDMRVSGDDSKKKPGSLLMQQKENSIGYWLFPPWQFLRCGSANGWQNPMSFHSLPIPYSSLIKGPSRPLNCWVHLWAAEVEYEIWLISHSSDVLPHWPHSSKENTV